MRVLITGVTGFVGGHLARALLEQGDAIVGVSTRGQWPEDLADLASRVRLEPLDLADDRTDCADFLARKQPEAIYHLAAQPNPHASVSDPRGTWKINLGGAMNLLEGVRTSGIRARILMVSSGVCYGNPSPDDPPLGELAPLKPNNPYASSKAAADLLAIQYSLSYGIDAVIARPFNHAGPGQSEKYVLSSLAKQTAEVELGVRERIDAGNLAIIRDFSDVRDIVAAYRLLVEKGVSGEIYNVGRGEGLKLADALETLIRAAKRDIPVHVDQARIRAVDLPRLVADSTKLTRAVGWSPAYSIEQTLVDMLNYWRRRLGGGSAR